MSEKNKIVYDEKGDIEKLVIDTEEYKKLKAGELKEIRIKHKSGDELLLMYEKK